MRMYTTVAFLSIVIVKFDFGIFIPICLLQFEFVTGTNYIKRI